MACEQAQTEQETFHGAGTRKAAPRAALRQILLAHRNEQCLIATDLQLSRRQPRFSLPRFLIAVLVVCAVVAVSFLAVSPRAHACLHAHHQSADHDCVIKHLADGKVLLPALDAPLPAAVWGLSLAPVAPLSLFVPPVSHRLPAGRAPPTV